MQISVQELQLCRGFLGLPKDHFLSSPATQIRQNVTDRTTTFLGSYAKCPSLVVYPAGFKPEDIVSEYLVVARREGAWPQLSEWQKVDEELRKRPLASFDKYDNGVLVRAIEKNVVRLEISFRGNKEDFPKLIPLHEEIGTILNWYAVRIFNKKFYMKALDERIYFVMDPLKYDGKPQVLLANPEDNETPIPGWNHIWYCIWCHV